MKRFFGLGLLALACACSEASVPDNVRITVPAAPDMLRAGEPEAEPLRPLSAPVETKLAEIRVILQRNSLHRLARLAGREPAFVSNFAGEGHRTHWDLLRRTGFDPLAQLTLLLDGPYGVKMVGDEVWYVWPDLAALGAEELVPERLSFSDRARLLELVGESGIEQVRAGYGYPGVRTAFAEDGRWLYFVHETEHEPESE